MDSDAGHALHPADPTANILVEESFTAISILESR
jgi:hypothetical protein